ncbi:MAG: ABC transporter ATP-binding protein [Alkalispirochaeta sp.]
MTPETTQPILDVRDLQVHFPLPGGLLRRSQGAVRAVDGVSLQVFPGETLGLVGESGCGKTTAGRAIVGLERPSAGSIYLDGTEIGGLSPRALRPLRHRMQMIFQDPYSSLDPRMTIGNIIAEPLRRYRRSENTEALVYQYMDLTGLPRAYIRRYPHEFSGGQRQRIGIARAIASQPELIIADEPVSALDVSIQAQILNLLKQMQQELGVAFLFIAHDLAVVKHISHRVAVMYLGKIMETAPARELYKNPKHPYTRALLQSVPIPDPARAGNKAAISGELPSPAAERPGCPFAGRCPYATQVCVDTPPAVEIVTSKGQSPGVDPADTGAPAASPSGNGSPPAGPSVHTVACHHWKEIDP